MSRSYKKAIFKCYGTKDLKHDANSVIRRRSDMNDHKFFRKCYESYMICDYRFDCRFEKSPNWHGSHRLKRMQGKNQYWRVSK